MFASIRRLAYGVPGDLINDYMRMSEYTCHQAMYRFCEDVIAVFGKYYLREPNTKDTAHFLSINECRRFWDAGQHRQIDCMHLAVEELSFWSARTFQRAFGGVHSHIGGSHDLWIWHSFFGMAGSNTDINMLHCSPVFSRLTECNAPQCIYVTKTLHDRNIHDRL
jgi:hypothetical protein